MVRSEDSGGGNGVLYVDERSIRRVARLHGPRMPVPLILLRRAVHEARVRWWKRVPFRSTRNPDACAAYTALSADDFAAINSLQAWASWRTIPRNLSGRLPARPILAIDLCCGTGESTAVLAYYCARGSRILGLEVSPQFVRAARSRDYRDRLGAVADVEFNIQSVLDAFRFSDGLEVAGESADLVHAIGAMGCHFDPPATRVVAGHCARVIRPGGLAVLDAGPDGTGGDELAAIFARVGFDPVHQARSCRFDRFTQLCLRKRSPARNAG